SDPGYQFARYHPYHITLNQDLNEQGRQQRVQFCQWARNQIRNEQIFFQFVMFSDESTFNSIGNVNSESYLNLIENELPNVLEHVDMNTRYRMWLQQDGAQPHYARIGYLKDTVYRERPTTANDMRMRIKDACANIPHNVLIRTVGHLQQRLQLCLHVGGATFEHLLS
ncbi:hypothetical protein TSAR_000037, partial [Trichomalopsis sarcophagae]